MCVCVYMHASACVQVHIEMCAHMWVSNRLHLKQTHHCIYFDYTSDKCGFQQLLLYQNDICVCLHFNWVCMLYTWGAQTSVGISSHPHSHLHSFFGKAEGLSGPEGRGWERGSLAGIFPQVNKEMRVDRGRHLPAAPEKLREGIPPTISSLLRSG